MTGWIAVGVCAYMLALAAPFASEAEAAGYRYKRCIAPALYGAAQTTWVCPASQRCCYDWLLRRGACVDRCF
jgi:hypothetical protein